MCSCSLCVPHGASRGGEASVHCILSEDYEDDLYLCGASLHLYIVRIIVKITKMMTVTA